ncbi:unnamed protein product [Dovyalis caffra]|uniref:Nucleoplasmin-like domain-containing protein n=1 Tax=Dovyalis caffra TaxID=77055 RepID=A0AAV1RWG2_9ROSI|nr:unnamed protein product [Dovyalis caffra]
MKKEKGKKGISRQRGNYPPTRELKQNPESHSFMHRIIEKGSTFHRSEWILFPMVGTGSSMKNSVVQCNETVKVVFSVIGPRSVHLTGYYLSGCSGQHFHLDDETYPFVGLLLESYGEDIADTETKKSVNGSDEDECEDSFINDDVDLEIMSPSTVYSGEVEELSDKKKHKNGKGSHKRLRKKFQFSESKDEDKMLIFFLHEKEFVVNSMVSKRNEKYEKGKDETSEKKKCMRREVEADKLSLDLPVTKEDQKTTDDMWGTVNGRCFGPAVTMICKGDSHADKGMWNLK